MRIAGMKRWVNFPSPQVYPSGEGEDADTDFAVCPDAEDIWAVDPTFLFIKDFKTGVKWMDEFRRDGHVGEGKMMCTGSLADCRMHTLPMYVCDLYHRESDGEWTAAMHMAVEHIQGYHAVNCVHRDQDIHDVGHQMAPLIRRMGIATVVSVRAMGNLNRMFMKGPPDRLGCGDMMEDGGENLGVVHVPKASGRGSAQVNYMGKHLINRFYKISKDLQAASHYGILPAQLGLDEAGEGFPHVGQRGAGMADLQWRYACDLGWLSNCAASGMLCGVFTENPDASPSETQQVQKNIATLWKAARPSAEEDMKLHTIPRTMGFGDHMDGDNTPAGSTAFHSERNSNMADRDTCIQLELAFMDVIVDAAPMISEWTLKHKGDEPSTNEEKKKLSKKPNHWFNGSVILRPWRMNLLKEVTARFFGQRSMMEENEAQIVKKWGLHMMEKLDATFTLPPGFAGSAEQQVAAFMVPANQAPTNRFLSAISLMAVEARPG